MVLCFVPECKHSSQKQNRPCNHFWRFPKDKELKKKWIKSIRRSDKEPGKYALVCSCHFKDDKKENGPTIFKRKAAKMLVCTIPGKQQRKSHGLEEVNLLSPSAEGTSCSKSTTSVIDEKTTCDKCPSLLLQLQEMKKENEKLHAEVEFLRTIAFPIQTKIDAESKVRVPDTEDDDEIFKPIPDMTVYASKVFQFRISLCFIEPEIWRRIQVLADFNFRELHLAIQCAMGWENYHLYKFTMMEEVEVGNPLDGDEITCAKTVKLPQYFNDENSICWYEYDFGKNWMHSVEFEEVLPKVDGQTYPRCIGGEITCLPEDGVYPPSDSEDDEETKEWKRKMKDPYSFDYKTVEFNFELIDNDF